MIIVRPVHLPIAGHDLTSGAHSESQPQDSITTWSGPIIRIRYTVTTLLNRILGFCRGLMRCSDSAPMRVKEAIEMIVTQFRHEGLKKDGFEIRESSRKVKYFEIPIRSYPVLVFLKRDKDAHSPI
jgi:hypothetical protein